MKRYFDARRWPKPRPGRAAAAVLVCGLAAAGCAPASRSPADGELRVLVYNIHAGKDAGGEHNLERVAELVKRTGADVALLQEVDRGTARSGAEDQPATLSAATGFSPTFGRTLDYQGGEYGIAILSRWAATESSVQRLRVEPPQERAGGSYEPRGALIARTDAPYGRLRLLNTHLDASRAPTYRQQEVAQVVALADSLRALGGWVLIGGDFNAEPDTDVIRAMTRQGWRDAFAECGVGEGDTFPSAEPVKRIDYLFIPAGLVCGQAEVIATATSDHRPLLVILRGTGGSTRR
jgi:endonuclease/exonuclease/phosphatase family metal-dependent hydrolase